MTADVRGFLFVRHNQLPAIGLDEVVGSAALESVRVMTKRQSSPRSAPNKVNFARAVLQGEVADLVVRQETLLDVFAHHTLE